MPAVSETKSLKRDAGMRTEPIVSVPSAASTIPAATAAPEKKEFWRWQENTWFDETKNWKDAKIITCGIDVGSVSSQAVLVCDGELYGYNSMRTGNNSPDSAVAASSPMIRGRFIICQC